MGFEIGGSTMLSPWRRRGEAAGWGAREEALETGAAVEEFSEDWLGHLV